MISAIVLTKNEEKNIRECLESLTWCGEIIVVDDESIDITREIAKELGAKVLVHPLEDDFSQQRNYGLEMARGEWVLFIDADERITEDLKKEIFQSSKSLEASGFYLKRKDYLFGKFLNHGETGNIKLLRLGKRGKGKWQRKVHEIWKIKGRIGELTTPLLHFPHPTVVEFLEEINRYSTLNADEFYRQGVKVGLWQIIAYPLGKFFLNYFFRLGFLDGTPGFILSIMMSFHSFLTRGLLWQGKNENY